MRKVLSVVAFPSDYLLRGTKSRSGLDDVVSCVLACSGGQWADSLGKQIIITSRLEIKCKINMLISVYALVSAVTLALELMGKRESLQLDYYTILEGLIEVKTCARSGFWWRLCNPYIESRKSLLENLSILQKLESFILSKQLLGWQMEACRMQNKHIKTYSHWLWWTHHYE